MSAQVYRFPILKPDHAGVPNCLKQDTSYKCTNVAPVYSYRACLVAVLYLLIALALYKPIFNKLKATKTLHNGPI